MLALGTYTKKSPYIFYSFGSNVPKSLDYCVHVKQNLKQTEKH